ncbi:MAG: hypothetical protein ABRQ27_07005 [Clostridiaceae bacterium]
MKTIMDLINDIKANKTSGASELAIQALQVIKQAAISSNAPDIDNFILELRKITDFLAECRPSMVTLRNCAHQFNSRLHNYISMEKNNGINAHSLC